MIEFQKRRKFLGKVCTVNHTHDQKKQGVNKLLCSLGIMVSTHRKGKQ